MHDTAEQLPSAEAPEERRFAPTERRERIRVLDVLRGVALFGILLVNMPLHNSPLALSMTNVDWWTSTVDTVVEYGIRFLAQGKFISIFSFLFGVGLAIQLERAEERGRSSARFFARRMLWLLVIGLVHAFFIWYGDVLVLYAAMGLVLIAFRKRQDRTLKIWAGLLLLVPLLLSCVMVGAIELGKMVPDVAEEIETSLAEAAEQYDAEVELARAAYAEGTLGEVLAQRAGDTLTIWSASLFFGPYVLGLFLLGLLAGRRRLLHNAGFHAASFRRALPWLLGAGLLGNSLLIVAAELAPHPALPSPMGVLSQVGFIVGVPALAAAYACMIVLLYQEEAWQARLAPFGAVGRMALTNYITQSLIAAALFNSHGLGWYGRVPPWAGLLLTIVIFGLQVGLSVWWLGRFRYGPLEWAWRSLTYRRLQPFRLET